MLLADVKEEEGPIDPFKTTFTKVEKKTQVLDKVTTMTHLTPMTDAAEADGPGLKNSHNYRWTTIENQFTRKKNRLFDELP